MNIDQESNSDDHCYQCKNELNILNFVLIKNVNYLSAICSPEKFKRIRNNDFTAFNEYCILIGDIIIQPDVCFQKMKEINERND